MIEAMSTLEERVLEAILATNMEVPDLAKKIGVTVQSIYDWKKGLSLVDMKARFLVELADAAGYEPMWIMKEKGLKKKSLTQDQVKILQVAELMQDEVMGNWIENGIFLTSVIPTKKTVDTPEAEQLESTAILQPEKLKGKDSAFRDFKADPLFKPGGNSRADGKKTLNKKEGNK